MKLLFDANLSYRIVKKVEEIYQNCLHVTKTGLPIPAEDIAIWSWEKQNQYIIVSNDEDFYHLSSLYGFPPKVVLVRTGNHSTNQLADLLVLHKADVEQLWHSREYGILEIF
jgi:predicted nuclease of predicted toxin-antitoxin system